MHIVEVRRSAAELGAAMAQMRTWLDHHQAEPTIFEFSGLAGEIRFRLQFKNESAALAFAAAFDGAVSGIGHAVAEHAA